MKETVIQKEEKCIDKHINNETEKQNDKEGNSKIERQ